MEHFKYIVYRDDDNLLSFLIFPPIRMHREFSEYHPISAGFVRLVTKADGTPQYECFGESISLELKSNPLRDSNLLNKNYDY